MSSRLRRALAATLVIAAVAIGFAYASSEWTFGRDLAMTRVSGWVAIVGLAFGLSLSPLRRLSSSIHVWRRAVGICTSIAAGVHGVLSLRGPLDGAWAAALSWPYLLFGALAFGILVLLLVTSFPRVIRVLRVRHWKVLHRSLYAAALFVIAHLMLSPWGSVVWKSAICALLLVLLAYRVLRRK